MEKISEIELFELLKKEITSCFFERNSASSTDISDWKGQDIVSFQEDLFEKTKSSVSEKWFYTYFKNTELKKLPRIDMLNILAQYVGYSGWSEFSSVQNNKINAQPLNGNSETEKPTHEIIAEKPESTDSKPREDLKPKTKKSKKSPVPAIIISIIGLAFLGTAVYFAFIYQRTYEFCFIDADRNTPITEPIEITVARQDFTPLELMTDKGCVTFPSKEDTLLMTIKSTYYKQDTFKIDLRLYQGRETIRLQPDDYKVMLRHYSKSSQSVKERIKMLDQMIDDHALIYQVYDNEFFGVEVLSKKQYINLMSLPTTSLKNFTLIEAEKNKNGKIIKIKFKINSDED
ncbi:MAG: hypothetical protein H3C39_03245 [Flavobacteriia bacterium]|nr:hypothetical protein [Flavobacteriia bacterium]